ncbi:hypothetical protein [Rubrimonas cliftonensis]|uniref:Uncharacterized protein n=1 Tax=Rubrimonas cliftonensis TaxID=89524 RepID=A0A1H4E535_9RHOB|nr:hypothetical protein [Rubrimonas cliftonensis]SEA80123.1 hypothetical protein SAMN05444370_11254 [Rubrimonas cliftonensis]
MAASGFTTGSVLRLRPGRPRTAPAERFVPRQAPQRAAAYALELRRAIESAARRRLPEDVRAEEITILCCFHASLVLNAVTGGSATMTFSARCHEERLRAANVARRMAWSATAALVDFGCAVLRGEAAHCEAAWLKHRRRAAAQGSPPSPM